MSRDQVKAFYDEVESDSSLQQQLKAVERGTADEGGLEKAVGQIVEIAKSAGFVFTKKDFVETVAEEIAHEQSGAEEQSTSRSCLVAYEWDDCYAAWGSPPPEPEPEPEPDPCGGGNSFIPPGYQPGDEDDV